MKKEQYTGEKWLINQVLAGDGQAVRKLYKRLTPRLLVIFKDKVRDKEDVEELIQDTFLHLLDALPLFRFQASLNTFVSGIARHELMDYWRKKYAKRVIKTVSSLEEISNSIFDSESVSKKMNEALEKAYGELKPIQVNLLKWKYEEGKSVKEIAGDLGWSIKAVEAQLYRSRKAFQKVYVAPETYE